MHIEDNVHFLHADRSVQENTRPSLPIAEIALQWLNTIESAHSRRAYATDWGQFLSHCSKVERPVSSLEQVTEPLLRSWLDGLAKSAHEAGKRPSDATLTRKTASIASLLRYCTRRGWLERNVADAVKRKKRTRPSQQRPLTEAEVRRVLTWAKEQANEAATALRRAGKGKTASDYADTRLAILCALFGVGMRVGEVCALCVGDFRDHEGTPELRLITKGDKEHCPIINQSTAAILRAFIRKHRAGAKATAPLFPSPRGTHILRRTVDRMVRDATSRVIGRAISPHGCRATLATVLVDKGVHISKIQSLLGHSDPKTTSQYIRLSKRKEHAAALEVDFIQ